MEEGATRVWTQIASEQEDVDRRERGNCTVIVRGGGEGGGMRVALTFVGGRLVTAICERRV